MGVEVINIVLVDVNEVLYCVKNAFLIFSYTSYIKNVCIVKYTVNCMIQLRIILHSKVFLL